MYIAPVLTKLSLTHTHHIIPHHIIPHHIIPHHITSQTMPSASRMFAYILGTGVVGGLGAGIILGGIKLREELRTRNVPLETNFDVAIHDGKNEENQSSCPLSDNFARLLHSKDARKQEHLESSFPLKDIGGRIAH